MLIIHRSQETIDLGSMSYALFRAQVWVVFNERSAIPHAARLIFSMGKGKGQYSLTVKKFDRRKLNMTSYFLKYSRFGFEFRVVFLLV